MRVRFAATLTANLLRAVAAFASGAVVARALGAADFGDLNFLLASFAAFLPLLDAGSSSAFFTFLARERRGARFFGVFSVWLIVQAVVPVVLIGLLLPNHLLAKVWLSQPRPAILLAFGTVFLSTQLWGSVTRMGEARSQTIRVQTASAVQALVHLALVWGIAAAGWLTVRTTIGLLMAEFTILCLTVGPVLVRENLSREQDRRSTSEVIAELWKYCRPVLIYSWVGVPYAFADRWMLQSYAGSAQQGFFSVASQFASVSLLATASILNVFWKEIVDAKARGDRARVAMLHGRVTRALYFMAALLSATIIPYTEDVLRWTVGSGYGSAAPVLALMLAYPVHQSLGQIQGTFLYASDDTRTFATIGIGMMVISIPLTYWFLGPRAARVPGLELGAVGLALKMVLLQFVSVNVQGWFIARKNGWSADFRHQVLTLGGLIALSFLFRMIAEGLFALAPGRIPRVFVVAVGITGFVTVSAAAALRWPGMAGVPKEELWTGLAAAKRRIGSLFPFGR